MRQNLNLLPNNIAKLVFDATCEENSVNLTYTSRLEDDIMAYISDILKNLVDTNDAAIEWPCKVLVSEFVSPEQFQQVCRKEMYRKPQQAILNDLTKMLNLQERRTLRTRRKTAAKQGTVEATGNDRWWCWQGKEGHFPPLPKHVVSSFPKIII